MTFTFTVPHGTEIKAAAGHKGAEAGTETGGLASALRYAIKSKCNAKCYYAYAMCAAVSPSYCLVCLLKVCRPRISRHLHWENMRVT